MPAAQNIHVSHPIRISEQMRQFVSPYQLAMAHGGEAEPTIL